MRGKVVEIFSPRTALILIAVVLVAMIGALLTASFKDDDAVVFTSGNNSFSNSAIGHKAFAESLKEQGMLSLISQYKTQERLTPQTVLMLFEPDFNPKEPEEIEEMLSHNRVLVSLPKWRGIYDPQNVRWLKKAFPTRQVAPLKLLKLIDPEATVYRPHAPAEKKKIKKKKDDKEDVQKKIIKTKIVKAAAREAPEKKPLKWTTNLLGFTPDLINPQLIRSDKLIPIVATDDGILIGGMSGERTKIIISDPDIMANFGLGRGQNAELVEAVLNLLYEDGNVVIIDETAHGFVRNPDLLRAAFEYPFIVITAQVIIFSCFLVWMTTQRFGAPQKLAAVLKPGKAVLIQNTVGLLERGNHQPEILVRYIDLSWRAVARSLRVPRNLDEVSTIAWLDHYGQRKGTSMKLETIKHRAKMLNTNGGTSSFLDQVHEKPLMQIIQHMETWKQEMLDGSGTDQIAQ